MSGHSKWSRIKRAKEVTDSKRSQEFGRLTRDISSAARAEKDPTKNSALRDAISRAKKANMPQQNIDRILQKNDNVDIHNVTYEGFGPGGAAFLIQAETDSQNRTVSEIRNILKNHNGQLGNPGSVKWKFEEDNTPIYPLSLSDKDKAQHDELMKELQEHEDIVHIHTDVV